MKVHCAYSELVDPKTLRPNPRNPNRHSATQVALLAGILEAAGWRQPITLSARSGYVVRGHGRLEASLLLGFDQVPVDRQQYASDAEELADLVADNRLSELAELDEDALAKVLRDLQGAGHDVQLAGFTEAEVARLLEGEVETDALENIPRMELQPFEHYDYLCFMFRDIRDWLRVLQLLEIGKVNYSITRRTGKIGVGRVIDGKRLLVRLDPHEAIDITPIQPEEVRPPWEPNPSQPDLRQIVDIHLEPDSDEPEPPRVGPGEHVDPARHHEPGPGEPGHDAPARPPRHARRARGRG